MYNRMELISCMARRLDLLKRIPVRRLMLLALALALIAALCACGKEDAPSGGARVLLDGEPWSGEAVPGEDGGARVYVTLDGAPLIDLPFAQAHTLDILQPDGEENAIVLTGQSVYMEHANCDNQDCVNMGEVTLENLEARVLGGFIVCLPHRLSVEVRDE